MILVFIFQILIFSFIKAFLRLRLILSMSLNFIIAWKNDKQSFDLAFHFSFNQNKLWTNWRSKWLFYPTNSVFYTGQSVWWKPMFFTDRHVWESLVTLDTQARQSSHLRYFRSPRPILLARTVRLVATFEDCWFSMFLKVNIVLFQNLKNFNYKKGTNMYQYYVLTFSKWIFSLQIPVT